VGLVGENSDINQPGVFMSIGHIVLPEAAVDLGFFSTKLTNGMSSDRNGAVTLTDIFPSFAVRANDPHAIARINGAGFGAFDGATVVVDGTSYFVGKSVLQATSGVPIERSPSENYSRTAEYQALFLGAHYMAKHHKVDGSLTIERICVGLPVATYFSHKASLEAQTIGTHIVPSPSDHSKSVKVHVKSCIVVSQPQGAALNYCLQLGRNVDKKRIVVLDLGGGTFDWFFLDKFSPNFQRSGGTQMGVLTGVRAICRHLDPAYSSSPLIMDQVNEALIDGEVELAVDGNKWPMADLWPLAQSVFVGAIHEMSKSVGNFREVDHFVFSGGGAAVLAKAARSEHSVILDQARKFVVDADPVFAIVKGFHAMAQMAGD
jgi:PRTRC genetic system protein D